MIHGGDTLQSGLPQEVQINGTLRSKQVFELIQHKMAVAGYKRTTDRINNKLKKEYRHRNDLASTVEQQTGSQKVCKLTRL